MTVQELKRNSPILRGLPPSSASFMEAVGRETTFEPGSLIFEEDGPADTFYLVASGKVGLEISLHTGPPALIETLGSGDMLGLSWLFPPHRWSWRARSLTHTTLLAFDAESLRNRCASDADLALHMYQAVAAEAVRRLHATRMRLLDIYPGGDE